MGTISEKILSRASGKTAVANDFVMADIDYAMAHDGTSILAVKAFREMEVEKVWNTDKIVIPFDHLAPANSDTTASLQKDIRNWIHEQKIRNFYDIGNGICHQVLPEKGFAMPGKLIVGADSHSCTYGAFGAFGTGVGATDMAEIFASGKLWFRVPESIKITVEGNMNKHVCAKDLTLKVVGTVGSDGATYKALEFYGNTISDLSVSGRMTLCNMAIEMGAKTGIVPPDNKTLEYVKKRAVDEYDPVYADDDAIYAKEIHIDVEDLEPQIARPHEVDNVCGVSEVEGTRVDQVFIGTCTNGRLEDLEDAAAILEGKDVAVRTIVIPASRDIMIEATKNGTVENYLKPEQRLQHPDVAPALEVIWEL